MYFRIKIHQDFFLSNSCKRKHDITVTCTDLINCCIVILAVLMLLLQIDEAADIIQKLHLIAQELPSGKYVFRQMLLHAHDAHIVR
jgi:hypothetical protein